MSKITPSGLVPNQKSWLWIIIPASLILTGLLSLWFIINWYFSIARASFLIPWSKACFTLSVCSLKGLSIYLNNVSKFFFLIKITWADVEVDLVLLCSFHYFDSLCFHVLFSIDWLSVWLTFSIWRNSCFEIEACSQIS